MTSISWTTKTWNPIVGCSIDTKGCKNCYAMRQAYRFSHNQQTPQYHGTAELVNGKPVWTGKINLAEKALHQPLRRRKPTTYFVNSMGDLFHDDVPDKWIDRVFAVMSLSPQHTFQILTKRAERMRDYIECRDEQGHHPAFAVAVIMALTGRWNTPALHHDKFPDLPNVWLGVSVEDQDTADMRIPLLLETPAALRFVSAEPLLDQVDLHYINRHTRQQDGLTMRTATNALTGDIGFTESCCFPEDWSIEKISKLDWVICGGESGPNARPMHPDWARSLRDQCMAANVPFHFKQWGQKKYGRLLDGVLWDQMPEVME